MTTVSKYGHGWRKYDQRRPISLVPDKPTDYDMAAVDMVDTAAVADLVEDRPQPVVRSDQNAT